MSAAACPSCGATTRGAARFCPGCGASLERPAVDPTTLPPPSASHRQQPAGPAELRTNVELAGLPLELWLVIGLFALPGIYLVQLALRGMPDLFRAYGDGVFRSLVLVLIILLLVVLALGCALLGVAYMLYRRDRVGRGLAYVAIGSLATLVVFSDDTTTGEGLSLLAGLIAAAILAFAPAVQAVFTGPGSPQRAQPTSIVVARVSLAIWLAFLALAALLNFLLVDFGGGKYAALGTLFFMLAVGVLVLYLRLPLGDRTTRIVLTAAAGLGLILLLAGRHDGGFVLLLGLTAAIPICLWLPSHARAFYGDAPLVVSTNTNA